MAPTSAKFIDKIICEGFSIIALGATTFEDIECNSLLEWWTCIRRQDVINVSRVEVWWTTLYFEPILKKAFFDYSLGGYSHRERWARTRRYFLANIRACEEEECYHNATRMPWLVTKVRPRDPSCVAWYTHMDALCWYVSVSMTRGKSWWTHWVPWESLGFILCKS
jgi:hypothetical protein